MLKGLVTSKWIDMSEGQAVAPSRPVAEVFADELAAGKVEVPLLPGVAAEVLSSSLDDKSNAGRLADLITQDQALATHLMRVVNSPAFRGATEIVALQQAIARLGMERIREIALTVSLKGTLILPGPYEYLIERAWVHGLRTGLWAKEIARGARKNVEMAYLCGLLHNVGTPMVVNRVYELDQTLTERDILELIDRFSSEAGLVVARSWHLPQAVANTIAFFGQFDQAGEFEGQVAITDAAHYFAQCQLAESLELDMLQSHPAIQHLNFYPDDIERLAEHGPRIEETVEGLS